MQMAGGGASIFEQDLDIISLALCLTILVFVTVGFELTLHSLYSRCTNHVIGKKMVNKITTELMILGFISFITVMVLQHDQGRSRFLAKHIAEVRVCVCVGVCVCLFCS